jgi:hypothetical protein
MKSVLPYARGLNLNSPNDWPMLCMSNTQGAFTDTLCNGTFTFLDFDIYGMPRFIGNGNIGNNGFFYFIWLKFSSSDFPNEGRWGIVKNNPDPYIPPIGCYYIGPTQQIGMPPLNIPNTYLSYPRLVYTGRYQYCDIASGPCP